MNSHLRSVAIMIEVTGRHTECTLLTQTTVRCQPLRYNGDPDVI